MGYTCFIKIVRRKYEVIVKVLQAIHVAMIYSTSCLYSCNNFGVVGWILTDKARSNLLIERQCRQTILNEIGISCKKTIQNFISYTSIVEWVSNSYMLSEGCNTSR